jgi:hypothetical protein
MLALEESFITAVGLRLLVGVVQVDYALDLARRHRGLGLAHAHLEQLLCHFFKGQLYILSCLC